MQRALPLAVAGGEAALGDRDDPLDERPQLLRLRHRRLDALVLDQRVRLVAEHRDAMLGDPAQFSMCNSVTHDSDPCRLGSGSDSTLIPASDPDPCSRYSCDCASADRAACRGSAPSSCRISLISLSDLRPKFLVLSISPSVFCTSSRIVRMFAFFRQLYDRTESSSSSTLLSRCSLSDARAAVAAAPRAAELAGLVEADEDGEVVADQLGRERHRVARRHRAVGPHLERQLVVVGGLADARGLDDVVHLLDRRVDRVDRNPADAEILVEVLVGRRRSRGRA